MPQKTCLIIGYGRAGKRHKEYAEQFGLKVQIFDPMLGMDGWNRHTDKPDYVVIATPPASHLDYIRRFIGTDSKILCEKPLCDLGVGEFEQAKKYLTHPNVDNVMVAYNWRYHPAIGSRKNECESVQLNFLQTRLDLPHWGLLLDHVSHGLDIFRTLMKNSVAINMAMHIENDVQDWWLIHATCGSISEMVTKEKKPRKGFIKTDLETFPLNPDPSMFTKMWERFLSGDFAGDYDKAILTQQLIEDCAKYDKS
jgi:predicted dehydrogenase